jgi:SAM-dependent methyltransferase
MIRTETNYWDSVASSWTAKHPQRLWREHSDAVNASLLRRWLPQQRVGRLLKTDVFDEAFGEGLIPLLRSQADSLICMDVSSWTIGLAKKQHARMGAVRVDVRSLPFKAGKFDVVVSNSTLDHFTSRGDILISLRELSASLRPGGELLLTLDNLVNPAIALRNVLPFRLLHSLGVLPYFVGVTLGPRTVQDMVRKAGLEIVEVRAIMHCPRVLAVLIARLIERYAKAEAHRRFLRWAMTFERLARWPTRYLTGHFLAVRAVKPFRASVLCEQELSAAASGIPKA